MSDTTQPSAPPPQAPPPAPPAPPPQAEVPINEAPVNQPQPLGQQAPPKPPHISRREALESAFTRSKEAQEAAAAKTPQRAKPGMGHNQPPEAMAKEPEAKAPEAKAPETQADKAQRYREGGKFARDPAKVEQPQPGVQPQPQAQQPRQLDKSAPYREPPGRFTDNAKVEWHATPEVVRGAVHQMAREFHGAYERFRGDHETMNELRPYHDLATKQGTSLRRAFDNYYSMEAKLREDLVGGLDVIIQNVARSQGLTGPGGRPLNITDVANHVVTMTPEQQQLSQQRNHQSSAEMRIGQLHQQVEQLSQGMGQLLYQQKFAGTRAQVDQFAEAHPRFDELADLVKSELDLGFPLEVAYKRAEMLRPAHAAQTRTQSAQTRKTSISGAPDGSGSATTRPSDGQRRQNGEAKHPTRREALAKAMRRVGNGV